MITLQVALHFNSLHRHGQASWDAGLLHDSSVCLALFYWGFGLEWLKGDTANTALMMI
jgi:hypothetical protein